MVKGARQARLGAKGIVIGAKQGIVAPRAWRRWFEFLPLPAWVERANQLAYANRAALSLFGSRSVAALQRVWKQLRPSRPARSGGLAATGDQADTVPCSAYAQARTKGGATVNLEIFFAPLPGSSQTTLFLARPTPAIQQLSEESRKERAARQRIQAQRRQQALWADLGTLVARVAHDIRNPLFGILATAEALESKFGNRETEEYFSVIRSEGERLSRLLAELMEYARPGSVHRKVRERLRTIVDQAILECQQRASERGVRLVVAEHDPDLWVRADVTRLTEALQNVIQNAVQHAPPSSEVVVHLQRRQRTGQPKVVCEVWDSGPGFQREELPHIFEPFYSRRPGGTGLGLAIAFRIVSDHGGSIQAGNRARGGAWVRIVLPGQSSAQRKAAVS